MDPCAMISACAAATEDMRKAPPLAFVLSAFHAVGYLLSEHCFGHLGVAHSPGEHTCGHGMSGDASWWPHSLSW